MPIEGPLRELGLPDVFQLLDLSRKTGMLRLTSPQRGDEGVVYFEHGRVVQANLRSKPPLAVDPAALTARELERKIRAHVQSVVFHLMAWDDGTFSFEERAIADVPPQARASLATESLLMESARRVDEWSQIAGKIPDLGVVPALAALPDDHESQLDLLPHEWEVLSLIDGRRNLRQIAGVLAGSGSSSGERGRDGGGEFATAKVVYGLVTTGVVEVLPSAAGAASPGPPPPDPEIGAALARGLAAVRAGDFSTARARLERFLTLAPDDPAAGRARTALDALDALLGALDGDRHG